MLPTHKKSFSCPWPSDLRDSNTWPGREGGDGQGVRQPLQKMRREAILRQAALGEATAEKECHYMAANTQGLPCLLPAAASAAAAALTSLLVKPVVETKTSWEPASSEAAPRPRVKQSRIKENKDQIQTNEEKHVSRATSQHRGPGGMHINKVARRGARRGRHP